MWDTEMIHNQGVVNASERERGHRYCWWNFGELFVLIRVRERVRARLLLVDGHVINQLCMYLLIELFVAYQGERGLVKEKAKQN